MKGTVFAVALNHRSQLDAWRDAFEQAPYGERAGVRGQPRTKPHPDHRTAPRPKSTRR